MKIDIFKFNSLTTFCTSLSGKKITSTNKKSNLQKIATNFENGVFNAFPPLQHEQQQKLQSRREAPRWMASLPLKGGRVVASETGKMGFGAAYQSRWRSFAVESKNPWFFQPPSPEFDNLRHAPWEQGRTIAPESGNPWSVANTLKRRALTYAIRADEHLKNTT